MKTIAISAGVLALCVLAHAQAPEGQPAPAGIRFHHVHVNSVDPSAAIAQFLSAYPASTKVKVAGLDGIRSANNITMLFTKVSTRPPTPGPDRISKAAPQTAFWHHVWASPDARALLERLRKGDPRLSTKGSMFIPQYTGPKSETVDFSSDTFPGFLTTAQVEEAARTALERRARHGDRVAARIDQHAHIDELVGKQEGFVVGKLRLELHRAGGRINLVVHRQQRPGRELHLLITIERIDWHPLAGLHAF